MSLWRRRPAPYEMVPAERSLAERLGVRTARVLQGALDGRDPLTTVSLEGPVPTSRQEAVAQAAAQDVWTGWPESADLLCVYLKDDDDPGAEMFVKAYGAQDRPSASPATADEIP